MLFTYCSFASTDTDKLTQIIMHTVHINLHTHIARFIPFQLRPISACVKGSLRGKERIVRCCLSHWYAIADCERETGTKGKPKDNDK